jgi:hypothetical protein
MICPSPGVAVGGAGGAGTVLGITEADGADGAPGPSAFVAVTVQLYDLPFVRSVTTSGDAVSLAEPGVPPFDDVQFAL